MKKIIGIALMATCLLGCKRELHDPALRQQLTTMISSLDDQNRRAAEQASEDLDAISSVNSAKMSPEQEVDLASAKVSLSKVNEDFALRDLNEALRSGNENQTNNIADDVAKAKADLSKVAASF